MNDQLTQLAIPNPKALADRLSTIVAADAVLSKAVAQSFETEQGFKKYIEDYIYLNLNKLREAQQNNGDIATLKNIVQDSIVFSKKINIGDVYNTYNFYAGTEAKNYEEYKLKLFHKVFSLFKQFTFPEELHEYIQLPIQTRMADVDPFAFIENQKTEPEDVTLSPIQDTFNRFGKELLILGAPGSGKTTLLYELGLSLAKEALLSAKKQDDKLTISQLEIPVLLNLTSWTTLKRRKKQEGVNLSIFHWLLYELKYQYGISEKNATELIDKKDVVLLLDGLDEVDQFRRLACVQELNRFQEEKRCPMVVCCRRNEYDLIRSESQTKGLKLGGAIEILPIEKEKIQSYLNRRGAADLLAVFEQDVTLQELLGTPLWLYLSSKSYKKSGWSLEDIQKEGWRNHLLGKYEDWLLGTKKEVEDEKERKLKKKPRTYTIEEVEVWIAWLAFMMDKNNQTLFFMERIQADFLPRNKKGRFEFFANLSLGLVGLLAVSLAVNLKVGLAIGLTFVTHSYFYKFLSTFLSHRLASCIALGLAVGLPVSLLVDTSFGSIFGPALGIVSGGLSLFDKNQNEISPIPIHIVESFNFSFSSISIIKVIFSVIYGLLFGTVLGGVMGVAWGLKAGLQFGFIVGLIVGVGIAIVGLLDDNSYSVKETLIPNQGIYRTGRYILWASIPGLVSMSFMKLMPNLFYSININDNTSFNSLRAISTVLLIMLPGAMGLQGWLRHYLIRYFLSKAGYMPYKYIPFLEYCCRLGYLKRVGGAYTFYHKEFRDYLVREYSKQFKGRHLYLPR